MDNQEPQETREPPKERKPPGIFKHIANSFAQRNMNTRVSVGEFRIFSTKLFDILEKIRTILDSLLKFKKDDAAIRNENRLEGASALAERVKAPHEYSDDETKPKPPKPPSKFNFNFLLPILATLGASLTALWANSSKAGIDEHIKILEKEKNETSRIVNETAETKLVPNENRQPSVASNISSASSLKAPTPPQQNRPKTASKNIEKTSRPTTIGGPMAISKSMISTPISSSANFSSTQNGNNGGRRVAPSSPPQPGRSATIAVAGMDASPRVSNKNIPNKAKALLDMIASPESGGRYDVIVGDPKGKSSWPRDPKTNQPIWSKHPGLTGMVTSMGPSTAAGRYQIVGKTWDRLTKKYPDLKDFSPASQDMAAWYLAQDDYKAKSGGRELLKDLNDPSMLPYIIERLNTTWTSFEGGVHSGGANDGSTATLTAVFNSSDRYYASEKSKTVGGISRRMSPKINIINGARTINESSSAFSSQKPKVAEKPVVFSATNGVSSGYVTALGRQ